MAINNRDKFDCKVCLKEFVKDFSDRIYHNEIFTTENKIDLQILNNKKSLEEMNDNEIKLVMESMEQICVYSKDFAQLLIKYLMQGGPNVNLE